MNCLEDKNRIIIQFPDTIANFNDDKKLASFLENLIINNNMIYHPSIFHNYIFYNESNELIRNNIYKLISINIKQKIIGQRKNYRELNRKNKLTISNITSFIEDYHGLIRKIDAILLHFKIPVIDMTFDKKYKWGKSYIIKESIKQLCTILMNDNIIFYF